MTTVSRVAGAPNRPTMETLPLPPGRFIVLEGPDGAGKSTVAGLLVDALRARGVSALGLREPGGHPGAEAIRSALLSEAVPHGSARGLLGFSTARAMLVEDILRPAIARGDWVVLDRWTPSTFVYQSEEGVSDVDIEWAVRMATRDLAPDHLFLLTATPATLLARLGDRGDGGDARERGLDLAKVTGRVHRYRDVVRRLGGQEVDTTHVSLEDVVRVLVDQLALPPVRPDASPITARRGR